MKSHVGFMHCTRCERRLEEEDYGYTQRVVDTVITLCNACLLELVSRGIRASMTDPMDTGLVRLLRLQRENP